MSEHEPDPAPVPEVFDETPAEAPTPPSRRGEGRNRLSLFGRRYGIGLSAVAAGLIGLAAAVLAGRMTAPGAGPPAFGGLAMLAGAGGALALAAGTAALAAGRRHDRAPVAGAALNALDSPICVTGSNGRPLYSNVAFVLAFGRPANLFALLTGGQEDDEAVLQESQRIASRLKQERAVSVELSIVLAEGGKRQFRLSCRPVHTIGAGLSVWRFEDIEDQHELHSLVARDHQWVERLLDEMPVGLYSVDESGTFGFINETLAEWLGSTATLLLKERARLEDFLVMAEDGSRKPFDMLAPAEDREIILAGRQGRVLTAGVSQAVKRDGLHLTTRSVVRDLAAERARNDAQGLARQRFQRFFEIAPIGIALADAGGRFRETNRALNLLLTGLDEKLVGRSLAEFVIPDQQAAVNERLAAVAGSPETATEAPLELRIQGVRERTAALFVSRLQAADGSLAGLILHFIDLTEQKSLELQFAQSQKMQAVGQLAGGVAHDFNNLLTAMIGFCDLLLLRFRPGDQSFADIMQVKQNANRAANLVRQLLAFSRQQTLQPKVIDIGEVLSELSHLLNRLLGENVELRLVNGRGLGAVRVDQGQLEQVVINLAVNARDAMPNGGTLTLRTSNYENARPIQRGIETMPPGSYVLIEVTDDGTGIPREIIARIFEPFFSTKEVGSGTGLGLSTVYGIVKQTGGFIFVDSVVGSGTNFMIYLPRHKPREGEVAVQAPAEPKPVRDLTGVGTILLVEDEDPVRLFSTRALRNKGYVVLEARSGEEALQLINSHSRAIDLIITDVVMPRMDGPTLIKHVRDTLPDVKVIFISGYTEDTFRKRIGDDAAIQFLPKPFSLQDLAGKVKELLPGGPAASAAANPTPGSAPGSISSPVSSLTPGPALVQTPPATPGKGGSQRSDLAPPE